jgi:hypothetical protein
MDHDPNHFPTLIVACVTVTIILYIIANVIILFHQQNLKNKQDPVINDLPLTTNELDEEQQKMNSYLQSVTETQ